MRIDKLETQMSRLIHEKNLQEERLQTLENQEEEASEEVDDNQLDYYCEGRWTPQDETTAKYRRIEYQISDHIVNLTVYHQRGDIDDEAAELLGKIVGKENVYAKKEENTETILGCPWCGSQGCIGVTRDLFLIHCDNEECVMYDVITKEFSTKQEAINAWNKRV